MKTITLKIRDKKIFPVFSGRLVAQNVNAYRFLLDLDEEWADLALTVTFTGPGGTKSVPLLDGVLEDDVPWEPVSASGYLKISVTGLETDGDKLILRLQTKEMGEELEIFPNGALPSEEGVEYTPNFEERMLALAQASADAAEAARVAAEKEGGGAAIDDGVTASDKTWSSEKISTEIKSVQDTLADIDAAFDGIIAIQESLIGGETA